MTHFIAADSVTRIVFCIEAFGMGLDCPNISQVLHFSPAKTVEGYVQEVGRSGRNGQQAVALCIQTPLHVQTNKDMKQYVKTRDKCRRQMLFEDIMKARINHPSLHLHFSPAKTVE